MSSDNKPTRAQQRRRTEDRILTAARVLFSEVGYERATARAVADAANVDPGLITYYFRSKSELFSRVTEIAAEEPVYGSPQQVTELLLAAIHAKLSDEPLSTLAMLRSMLTHPEATEGVRQSLSRQQQQLSDALTADNALLRTGLTSAITLGVVVGRYMLKLDGLRDADPGEITALLRPGI
ncbi:TetR family transcriptional regulator [Nocardia sp. NBC_01499]|uniref:TetR family transcriptional regulator n=1 Tax=Nocardia sp. NBC_01499 TaxID=2903597 RepID=UPI00386FADE1